MHWYWITAAGFIHVVGHMFTRYGEVDDVGKFHYWVHSLYARFEPVIIHINDYMCRSPFFSKNPMGKAIYRFIARTNILLPHGVVIPTNAAINILKDIEKYSGDEVHIAVGPCVCQRVLERYREPTCKDITIWYGAEIYKRFFDDEYELISADKAKQMLHDFHKQGLTPVAEFLMQNRKWMFVLCNCDGEICCPTRVFNITGRSLYPGPYIARQISAKCLGAQECGICVDRCNFNANYIENTDIPGKGFYPLVSLDEKKCLGCGLCVTTCKGKARRLDKRAGYSGRLLPWEYVKDAEIE